MKILNLEDKKLIISGVEPIPKEWEEARRRISSEAGHHTIIAGGAIRDHVLGLPAKDIDIFVLGMSARAANETFGAEITEYAGVEEAKHHYQPLGNGLPDIDLVFSQYTNVRDVLADFDLGICRVAWDGWDFVITDDFARDLHERTITVFDNSYADHRNRVVAKLGPHGFKMINSKLDVDDIRKFAHHRGYRLMHRRDDKYWLMRYEPLTLNEILDVLHYPN